MIMGLEDIGSMVMGDMKMLVTVINIISIFKICKNDPSTIDPI